MKKILLTISLIILVILTTKSQDTLNIKYYKSIDDESAASRKNAKVVEFTIQEANGLRRFEMKEIENQKILRIKRYKDREPTSMWFYAPVNISEKPLEFEYNLTEYTGFIRYDLNGNKPKETINGDFKSPKFPDPNISFLDFVALGVKYPLSAKESGIQGTVTSQFILNKSGEITAFSILKSANTELDKEVARIVLKSPRWVPAELNGMPIDIHIVFPTNFIIK